MKRILFDRLPLLALVAGLTVSVSLPAWSQECFYKPIEFGRQREIKGKLTDADIPTGEGGFARDYRVKLEEGDQVAIDLLSDDFDGLITLMSADGTKIGENDDGPDGTTNSLLFVRIKETGDYTVRIRSFEATGEGNFTLQVTRLRPVE